MAIDKKNYFQYLIDSGQGSLASLKVTNEFIKLRDNYIFFDFNNTNNKYQAGYTIVYPGCRTGGHAHINSEEIYHIIDGKGKQIIGEEEFEITIGDTFIVPVSSEHTTINTGCIPLKYFWIVINVG